MPIFAGITYPLRQEITDESKFYIFYDDTDESFMYYTKYDPECIISNRTVHSNISSVLFDWHRRNYCVFPDYGSDDYHKLISANSEENIMRSRAKPADPYSFVITFHAALCGFHIKAPAGQGQFRDDFSANLDEAYEKAHNFCVRLRNTDLGAWNVWPRRNSLHYKELEIAKEKEPKPNPSGINNFNDFIELVNRALKNKDPAQDEYALNKAAIYIHWRKYNLSNDTFKIVREYLHNYVNTKTGLKYELATGASFKLIHPANIVRMHSDGTRSSPILIFSISQKQRTLSCAGCKETFAPQFCANLGSAGLNCKDCTEQLGFYRCSSCSDWHHEDRGCPHMKEVRADHIYNYGQDVRAVIPKMFSIKEKDKPVNGAMRMYGLELEVLPKDNVSKQAAAHNCGSALKKYAILKSDSSLGVNGFEIVTAPATMNFHREVLWKKFFELKGLEGLTAAKSVRSWATKVCGIHVHITRASLTEMQLAKLLVFYHETHNTEFLSRIAGRMVGPEAIYCKTMKKKLGNSTNRSAGDHHGAITVSSRNKGKTAEVRIFRGNATYHGIMRCIEFVDATAKWCGENSSSDILDYKKFIVWFNRPDIRSMYPELKKHLIELKYIKSFITNDKYKHLEQVPDILKNA